VAARSGLKNSKAEWVRYKSPEYYKQKSLFELNRLANLKEAE